MMELEKGINFWRPFAGEQLCIYAGWSGLHLTGEVWEWEWKSCLGSCNSAGIKGAVEMAVGDTEGGLALQGGVLLEGWP